MDFTEVFEKNAQNQLIFKKPYGEVRLPEDFIAHRISEIVGQEVITFGLFNFFFWDTEDYHNHAPQQIDFVFPSMFRLCPSRIDLRKGVDGGSGEYVLEFVEGDVFIATTVVAKSSNVARAFVDILFKGYIPDTLAYDELYKFWADCNALNGINLNVSAVVIQTILSEFARNPDKFEEPFRIAINEDKSLTMLSRFLSRIGDLPRFNSTFASLSSADPKQGITASVSRHRNGKDDTPSPIEKVIS